MGVSRLEGIKYLYHGTDALFKTPDLACSRKANDFGPGFYLTSNASQAIEWAHLRANRKKHSYVYRYPFIYKSEIKELPLCQYDENWLKLVKDNRNGIFEKSKQFDMIYDKMADGKKDTGRLDSVLMGYEMGDLSANDAIKLIKYTNGYDQYCLKTKIALEQLNLSEQTVFRYTKKGSIWIKEDYTDQIGG